MVAPVSGFWFDGNVDRMIVAIVGLAAIARSQGIDAERRTFQQDRLSKHYREQVLRGFEIAADDVGKPITRLEHDFRVKGPDNLLVRRQIAPSSWTFLNFEACPVTVSFDRSGTITQVEITPTAEHHWDTGPSGPLYISSAANDYFPERSQVLEPNKYGLLSCTKLRNLRIFVSRNTTSIAQRSYYRAWMVADMGDGVSVSVELLRPSIGLDPKSEYRARALLEDWPSEVYVGRKLPFHVSEFTEISPDYTGWRF